MDKKILYLTLEYLNSFKNDKNIDSDNLEIGLQCLSVVFGMDLTKATLKKELNIENYNLEDIFDAGYKALTAQNNNNVSEQEIVDPIILENTDLWNKWLAKIQEKGFFQGTEKGTPQYNERYNKALEKFKEKFAQTKAAVPSTTSMTDDEKEKEAEKIKSKGNTAITSGDYKKAVAHYEEAIKICPKGKNTHIYHSNLAAALMHLENYKDAIKNCEMAIELNPSYVKSYSRMATAYFHLKEIDLAMDAYYRGLEIEPNNETLKQGLKELQEQQEASSNITNQTNPSTPAPGGMPDLSSLAAMIGGAGGGGLANMMNNPDIASMASNMMKNPAMMQMAQNMMSNPEMMKNMMSSLGEVGAAGAAGRSGMDSTSAKTGPSGGKKPDFSNLMKPDAMRKLMSDPKVIAMRQDPEMKEFFDDIDANGPSAALKHMSNPKVAKKVQSLFC